MTTQAPRGVYPQSYLPHYGTEFEGHAPVDAASKDAAVENAMMTIREILTEERRTSSRRSLPDLAPGALASHIVVRPRRGAKKSGRLMPKGAITGKLAALGVPASMIARLKNLRPTKAHGFWLAAFALVWCWPMFVLVALFIAFLLLVLGTVIFGAEWINGLRDMSVKALPKSWAKPKGWPPLTLRREPEPDPFEAMPDPFDRISAEQH